MFTGKPSPLSMNFVEPIRDKKQIAHIKNVLRGQGQLRDLLLFVVGINTALRISDLLQLRIGDFLDDQQRMRSRFWLREEKRGKRHEVVINDSIRETLADYLVVYPDIVSDAKHFVFFTTKSNDYAQPLKRGQAWKFITTI